MENFGNVCTEVVAVRISAVTFEVSKTNPRAVDGKLTDPCENRKCPSGSSV